MQRLDTKVIGNKVYDLIYSPDEHSYYIQDTENWAVSQLFQRPEDAWYSLRQGKIEWTK